MHAHTHAHTAGVMKCETRVQKGQRLHENGPEPGEFRPD